MDQLDAIMIRGKEIGSQQWPEFKEYLAMVADLEPSVVMEVGYYKGGTLWMHAAVSKPRATIIGIDPYAIRHEDWTERIEREMSGGIDLHLLGLDCHDKATLDKVMEILDGRQVDAVFIDDGHSYDDARSDIDMYGPLVRPGGIIALHDIVVHHERVSDIFGPYDTDRVWSEIKRNNEFDGTYVDVVRDPGVPCSGHGIGVIMVGMAGREQ